MKKTKQAKLGMSRETLRLLSIDHVQAVRGGDEASPPVATDAYDGKPVSRYHLD